MEEKEKYCDLSNLCTTEITCEKVRLDPLTVCVPKAIGEIVICGVLRITIYDDTDFIKPTEEQIKNLHNMLCIDVRMFDEDNL